MTKNKKTSDKPATKRRWGRFLLKFFMGILVFLIIALITAYLYAGALIKKAITIVIPPITQTTAGVSNIDLSLIKGHIEINGLYIGNPKGFSSNNIFELGKIDIRFEPKSIFSDKIIINSVLISGTGVSVEMDKKFQSNIAVINQNIQSYLESPDKTVTADTKKQSTQETTSQSAGKKIIIKDLTIDNSKLSLGFANQTTTIRLPKIHITDIGEGKQKKSFAEITADVLNLLTGESVKSVATQSSQFLKDSVNSIKESIKNREKDIKGNVDSLKENTKKRLNDLKDLFK